MRRFPPETSIPAGSASASATEPLGALPEWNLADLYDGMNSPRLAADIEKAKQDATTFRARYQGKLDSLAATPPALAEAVKDFERLEDLLGRIGSYAGLLYAADTANPQNAKFYGDMQETLTNISSELIFFGLELNTIDDTALAAAVAHPSLAPYKPLIDDLRKEKPYQLEEKLEQLFHEKSVTGASSWNRLFNETMTSLRFSVEGQELAIEPTLNLMSDAREERRRQAAEALASVFRDNVRLFTLITNTLAQDK
jgi:oligoendopeptidase F